MAANKKYDQITSLQKGIHVLELLAQEKELIVSEVAKKLGYNRASSQRNGNND